MKMMRILMLLALLGAHSVHALVIDDLNGSSAPEPYLMWVAQEVGWLYTPTLGYDLTGINTMFGSGDDRTINIQVFLGLPDDGNLLRETSMTPVANTWAGGDFAPLTLTVGNSYFIGFQNTDGLFVNITSVGGDNALFRYDYIPDGTYDNEYNWSPHNQPLIQFEGNPNRVPDAGATMALLGSALCCLGILRRKLA